MHLTLYRFINAPKDTIGKLYVNDAFQCYTLEDQYREAKVPGQTRIPAGTYEIKLRTFGTKNAQYTKKFPAMHHGMLWLQNVNGFDGILIHIGNSREDTKGCILVGRTYSEVRPTEYELQNSTAAYMLLYPAIARALLSGEKVFIEIK